MDDVSQPDPRVEDCIAQMKAMLPHEHTGEVFEEQTIFVDGRRFRDCRFIRCIFVIAIGRFTFEGHNRFTECQWRLAAAIESTVKFLDYLRSGGDPGPTH